MDDGEAWSRCPSLPRLSDVSCHRPISSRAIQRRAGNDCNRPIGVSTSCQSLRLSCNPRSPSRCLVCDVNDSNNCCVVQAGLARCVLNIAHTHIGHTLPCYIIDSTRSFGILTCRKYSKYHLSVSLPTEVELRHNSHCHL